MVRKYSTDEVLIEVADRHGPDSLYYIHEWITPNNASVVRKKEHLLREIHDHYGKTNMMNIITKFFYYVAVDIKYVDDTYFGFVYGDGDVMRYEDYWQFPAEVISSGVADCDGKSFLLTSLLRAVGFSEEVVFSNIGFVNIGGETSGHVYTTLRMKNGEEYLLDPSISDWAGIVVREVPEIYKTLIAFNDRVIYIMEDGTDILQKTKNSIRFEALVGDWKDMSPSFRLKLIKLMRTEAKKH